MEHTGPSITPGVVYDDADAGLAWLVDILGFESQHVFRDGAGSVTFAQLMWGGGTVFVSGRAGGDNPWRDIGPASIALVADDQAAVDGHYARVVDAGADVVRPQNLSRTPLFPEGSYQFDVRDPGGNLWTVGTYRPRV